MSSQVHNISEDGHSATFLVNLFDNSHSFFLYIFKQNFLCFNLYVLPVILLIGTAGHAVRRYPETKQVTNPVSGKMAEQKPDGLSTLIIFPGECFSEEKIAKGTIQIYNFAVLLSQKNHIQIPPHFDYNSLLLQTAYKQDEY